MWNSSQRMAVSPLIGWFWPHAARKLLAPEEQALCSITVCDGIEQFRMRGAVPAGSVASESDN
jgi:hypothetical protein